MKVVIAESKLKETIENTLKKQFPEIVKVEFKSGKVYLASDGVTIDRTSINVILDCAGIFNKEKINYRELKEQIFEFLEYFFNIDWKEYGSKWDITVLCLRLVKI